MNKYALKCIFVLIICILLTVQSSTKETDIIVLEVEKKVATQVENTTAKVINNCKITAYCPCSKCCGKWSDGLDYSGNLCEENKTIAVDKNIIPLGSDVYINGVWYKATDTGVRGNHIDVYMSDHKAAREFGVKYCDIIILTEVE